MRVLHLDTGGSWRGGQQQVLYLNRELARLGVECLLACTGGGELEKRAAKEGLNVRGLPLRGEWDIGSAFSVSRLLKNFGATHLHLHSSHAQGIGMIAAKISGFRNVVVTRRVDFPIRRHLANRWKYGTGVARFIAISRAIAKELESFGIEKGRIRLVHSGVDPNRAAPGAGEAFRRELGLKPGQPLVGNIAHLADHKGQRYLIEAIPEVLKSVPDARFVVVGEGELEEELKRLASGLGLGDRLVFTGFRDDVDAIMDALDVFVMSSTMEGLGTIVADALAARRAVVATRAGGIPEIIDDGADGLIVPPRDSAALSQAIARLLLDGGLRARLGEAGRAKVLRSFSAEATARGNLEVYRELIAP